MLKNALIALIGGGALNLASLLEAAEKFCGEDSAFDCTSTSKALIEQKGFPFSFLASSETQELTSSIDLGSAALNYAFWGVLALVLFWFLRFLLKTASKIIFLVAVVALIVAYFGWRAAI